MVERLDREACSAVPVGVCYTTSFTAGGLFLVRVALMTETPVMVTATARKGREFVEWPLNEAGNAER
jgi:hypothetical protein